MAILEDMPFAAVFFLLGHYSSQFKTEFYPNFVEDPEFQGLHRHAG